MGAGVYVIRALRNEDWMADRSGKQVQEKTCPACGEMFVPRQLSGGSRVYCYRPECEIERERERKRRYRAKKRECQNVEEE